MATINIDDLQPGMVLASPAQAANGRVLLAAGVTLTEKHITIFRTWGLTEADIEGVSKEEVAAQAVQDIDPEILQRTEQETQSLFRHTRLDHPLIAEIFRTQVQRRAQQLNRER